MKYLLVVIILLIHLTLLLHNYTEYPQRGATSDEYSYSFLGVSLLTKHMPISWSTFSVYPNRFDLTIRGIYFPMVYPYFDHPPLNGIVVGGFAMLFGQNTFEKIDLKTIRLVPIFLSLCSSFLVFLIAKSLFDFKTATWALLIYTTTTVFIMNQRVVFAENLLTPLFLLVLYLFIEFKQRLNIQKALLLGVLCGAALWAKESGIAVGIGLIALAISERVRPKFIALISAAFLLFFLAYLGYAFYFGKEVFLSVIGQQAARHSGPQTLLLLFSTPVIVNKVYPDGWYFFGFISLFASFLDIKKFKAIIIPSFVYLLFLLATMTREGQSGWYMLPIFPFMAITTATLLSESIKKHNLYIFVFLLFVGLYQIQMLYEANFGLTPFQFRILLALLLGPMLFLFAVNKTRLFQLLSTFWFYAFILGNIILTYNYIHPS